MKEIQYWQEAPGSLYGLPGLPISGIFELIYPNSVSISELSLDPASPAARCSLATGTDTFDAALVPGVFYVRV